MSKIIGELSVSLENTLISTAHRLAIITSSWKTMSKEDRIKFADEIAEEDPELAELIKSIKE